MPDVADAIRDAIVADEQKEQRQSARMLGMVIIATLTFWGVTAIFWFFG